MEFEMESALGFQESMGSEVVELVDSEPQAKELDRPCFHVMPRTGWMNDPNGPIFFNGQYHMFYQQVLSGITWDFGIVWGHATSPDLVHWEHLPAALVPTPGGPDANGCFSGCCTVDPATGLPTILYTGVRLRTNEECGPLPPKECDLSLEFIESQCMAVADPGDPKLMKWTKSGIPFLQHPPSGLPLTGWRDPFIVETGSPNKEWLMLMGSGLRGAGGAILKYKSQSLSSGWTYDGVLCMGDERETGTMWECPILVNLKRPTSKSKALQPSRTASGMVHHTVSQEFDLAALDFWGEDALPSSYESKSMLTGAGADAGPSTQDSDKYLFCVSPDAPENPVLYWIGNYVDEQFIMETAEGPFRLDLGDVMYAPNMTKDAEGRHLLWGWLQERSRMGEFDYAGCLSVPRLLHVHNGRLFQEPAPEIADLRKGKRWHEIGLHLYPEESTPLEGVGGQSLDIELTIERGTSTAAGVQVRAWESDGENCLILFDWDTTTLEVIRGPMDVPIDEMRFSEDRAGGGIDLRPGDPLEIRILLDHSALEIYTGTGEVLSTRVYRGRPPPGADSGIDFLACGGIARLARVWAFEMGSIWKGAA
ncbi:hypothetical protein BSKO_10832 [Bryopsis sp. KO-2023]|nr:hypothetical protein BSKO_10832 [Bryopsis sp. KO-2023]